MQLQMDMGGPFNLGALVPMLEEARRWRAFSAASACSASGAWINVGIGLAVLYERNTRNIAIALLSCCSSCSRIALELDLRLVHG